MNEVAIESLMARLDLAQKVSLLTGGSAWGTVPLPEIGLREMVLSDGPSGVRGANWDERDTSISLPSATSLSSSWDVSLAREYGQVVAGEARRKHVDVVLGPTVNLHRSPLGGRHFEAFSEDPLLTAELAVAYIEGVQSNGVGACVKHYVANDFETDRFHTNVVVDETTLRELYLYPFERAVVDGNVWAVMSAYNSVNGATCTESELLTTPLRTEWGFEGTVISDWTAVRSLESARYDQDLAMPGPDGPWGAALVEAVRTGEIDESLVDQKVRRILKLAARVGALNSVPSMAIDHRPDSLAFVRRAAAEGMVLVRNDGLLPLSPSQLTKVVVIGENAQSGRFQGGGSATVLPEATVNPLEGIRATLEPTVTIDYLLGSVTRTGFEAFGVNEMTNPTTGNPGAHVSYVTAEGEVVLSEERFAGQLLDYGRPEAGGRVSVRFETLFTPAETGVQRIGFGGPGSGRLLIDGTVALEQTIVEDEHQVQGFFSPPVASVPVEVRAGHPLRLQYDFVPGAIVDGVPDSFYVTFGAFPLDRTADDEMALIARAARAASEADVAVVVVGTTEQVECEGYDRENLRLPGRQDELVSAVAAGNPNTIVVVNAGAPVEMPWRDEVGAILLTWFGGQQYGDALADVLVGASEPGGRLPTTWPTRLDDAPVVNVTPREGTLTYDEGSLIGYRAWESSGVEPAYWFGHGLSYTTWTADELRVEQSEAGLQVSVRVQNTGSRSGKQVLQVYASRIVDPAQNGAERGLVGFAVVRAEPGGAEVLELTIPMRALSRWRDGAWVVDEGQWLLEAGFSAADLSCSQKVRLVGATISAQRA